MYNTYMLTGNCGLTLDLGYIPVYTIGIVALEYGYSLIKACNMTLGVVGRIEVLLTGPIIIMAA